MLKIKSAMFLFAASCAASAAYAYIPADDCQESCYMSYRQCLWDGDSMQECLELRSICYDHCGVPM